jgi:hypothetical protein
VIYGGVGVNDSRIEVEIVRLLLIRVVTTIISMDMRGECLEMRG